MINCGKSSFESITKPCSLARGNKSIPLQEAINNENKNFKGYK